MPEPLEYFNPRKPVEEAKVSPAARLRVGPRPAELDAIVVESTEHAAVAAIVNALAKKSIDSYIDSEQKPIDRTLVVYVCSAQWAAASLIAAEIFAVRTKFKKFV